MKNGIIKKFASAALSAVIVMSSGVCAFSAEAAPALEFGEKITDGMEVRYINPDGTEYTRHIDENTGSSQSDGEIFSDGDITFYSESGENLKGTSIPSSFDLRDVDGECYVTRPECQYNGDCWTFATMGTLESNVMMQGYDEPHFSKSHLSYFAYTPKNEGYTSSDPMNVGGNSQVASATLMNLEGIADKSDYPNAIGGTVTYSESDRFNHGSGYVFDESVELKTTDEVKAWIMENGAVFTSYYMTKTCTSGSLDLPYQYNQVQSTNHAITVIGWDDSIPASAFAHEDYDSNGNLTTVTPSCNGAWIVKNTVALTYNGVKQEYYDNNYMYVPYDQYFGDFVGFRAEKDTDLYNHYTYSERDTSMYFGMVTAEYADVFTAEGNEKISEIGFELDTGNQLSTVTATFKIYKNLPSSYTGPTDGTLAGTFTETYTNDGFYTFELPEKISISEGEIYSVVISCTDSGGCKIHVPCEGTNEEAGRYYTGAARQSYFKSGNRYIDLYTTYRSSNIFNVFMHVYTECSHTEAVSGSTVYCTQCGKTLRTLCEHSWDSGTVTPATCTSEGKTVYTCTKCGETKTETTAKLAHTLVTVSGYDATCTADGLTDGTYCSVCGQTVTAQTVIPATGHSWGTAVTEDVTAATCTEAGSYYIVNYCTRCGAQVNRVKVQIPALGHASYVSKKGTAKTCTADGLADELKCSRCGITLQYQTVIPAGHTDSNSDGICDSCGALYNESLNIQYKLDRVTLTVPGGKTVSYKNKVKFTVSSSELPEGYSVALYDGSSRIGSESSEITYTSGELTSAKTYTFRVIAPDGSFAKNSAGNEISKTFTVSVNAGFFQKIIAFFRGLFGSQPTVNI